ncbi:E-selectin-like [Pecten maximus]|uniref:E-selectin-like n=1 Tax=Pecten maximus TaxID=6579 RepID=UPI001458AE9E|nr:E-selectin-like [Pecten maximus]
MLDTYELSFNYLYGRITQSHGLNSGTLFAEGSHSFGYTARDNHRNTDTCTKEFAVRVRRCTSMPIRPANGEISCEPHWYDPLLGSTCTFTCHEGYSLTGSKTRTCGSDNTFDGTAALCSKISCPSLPDPENGQAICSDSNFYKSVCMTSCPADKGYGTVGVFVQCRNDGTWSGSLQPCYGK